MISKDDICLLFNQVHDERFLKEMDYDNIDATFDEIIEKITDEKLSLHRQISIIQDRIHELDCVMQDINAGFDYELYVTGLSKNDYETAEKDKQDLELTLEKYKERYPEFFI